MLTFTSSGAVQAPTTVQIRVTRSFPGRVAAGAPAPERSLSDDELRANLRYFTEGLKGPRTRPCTALVLSGLQLGERDALANLVAEGRQLGLERVTLHLGRGDRERFAGSALSGVVDAVAVTVQQDSDIDDLAALAPLFRTAVLLLDEQTLPNLPRFTERLAGVGPDRIVFTWPFPPSKPPPAADEVVAKLRAAVAPLLAANVGWGVKGLPACTLGDLSERLWRSGNRWYVDASHQLDRALLFFPDVVRFGKDDECRYCSADARCDGAPEAWLNAGLAGRLKPID